MSDLSEKSVVAALAERPDSDRRYYVYKVGDPKTPETPLYIGKGTADRLHDHVTDARAYNAALENGLRPKCGRFVRKYAKVLREGGGLESVKLLTGLTHQEALDQEKALIAKYGRLEEGGSLYNLSAGGEGVDPAITGSPAHRQRAAKQIRLVNTNPEVVKARRDRLHRLHSDPKWHAAAVERLRHENKDAATRARMAAAATAGRRKMLADRVRRARLVAACSEGQRRRLAEPSARAKHREVMKKVHAHPDWRKKLRAGVRMAHARPSWRVAYDRGMARRNEDGLHGARVREGLRRKRREDPLFAAEQSERGRLAMKRLHADPRIQAHHRARLSALHKDPQQDAWRRARQQWYFACRRAAKSGLQPPPPPDRGTVAQSADATARAVTAPSRSTTGPKNVTSTTSLRNYSASAAKQPGQRSLAQLVKVHKKRLGVTYREVAKAAGLSVATLWELVHSAQVKPTLDTVHRVAFVLGFSLGDVAPPL